MTIGTHTGEQFESLFDLQIARQDAKQPVTGVAEQLPTKTIPPLKLPNSAVDDPSGDEYENLVDKHIQEHKPEKDQIFRVDEPNGPIYYKYLGPNSGGRKDWMQVDPQSSDKISSTGEVKMAKDIELSFPPGVPVDSDTPGVSNKPENYYNPEILRQPDRWNSEGLESGAKYNRDFGSEPLGNRTIPMENKTGRPQISLNEYEEASPFKVAMADMAPEGMRIPVSRIQQTRRQELAGGGGGGGVQSIEQKGVEAYRKALEPPKEYAIKLTDKDKQGNSYNYQFRDKEDKVVGGVSLQVQNGGKDIHIDYVDAWKIGGSNTLGTKNTRDLLRQLKAEFPDAERLYGYRVSGARREADNTSEAWIPLKPGVRVMDKVKESQHNENLRREQDRALRDELSSLSTQEVGRRRQIIEDALDRNPSMTREEIRGLFNRPATDPLDQIRNQNLDRLRQLGGTNRDPYEQVPFGE